jgi:integrase
VALSPTVLAERDAEAGIADAWLFPDATGDLMDGDNFRSRTWEPLRTAAEMRKVRIHDLRHTYAYASQFLQAGVELLYVSQQLGHHSPAFTLAQYAHLLPKRSPRRGESPRPPRNPDASDDPATLDAETETARNSLELRAV